MRRLLSHAGVAVDSLHGPNLLQLVVAEARDGYVVAFSLGELSQDLGNHAVVVAFKRDAKAIPETDGPFRLLVPGETRGARAIRQLARLHVMVADPAAGAGAGAQSVGHEAVVPQAIGRRDAVNLLGLAWGQSLGGVETPCAGEQACRRAVSWIPAMQPAKPWRASKIAASASVSAAPPASQDATCSRRSPAAPDGAGVRSARTASSIITAARVQTARRAVPRRSTG